MSLSRRLFLTLVLIVVVGFLSIARWIQGELRDSYGQIVEEILVDAVHLMAAHLENHQMSAAALQDLDKMFSGAKAHMLNAKIFDYIKTSPGLELYVADKQGKVIYSTRPNEIGNDFSQWNDVYKTLRGEYGARSTRLDAKDARTSVYFVAAPIVLNNEITGVVTIYKTEGSILVFLDRALSKMFAGGFISVLVLGALGGLILIWITRPLEKLRQYAIDVSEGKRGILSNTTIKEIKQLTQAFEIMRTSLEGKKSIEHYTQSLTHELKSPLTAIKGAAELCLEEMDHSIREKFLYNIIEEAQRSHSILEQLLKIASLEAKNDLDVVENVEIFDLLQECKEALMPLLVRKNLRIEIKGEARNTLQGDRFLLFQSFRNIIQNAIDFSERDSIIYIIVSDSDKNIQVEILDEGVGIPSFALSRIYDKFYSLDRPDSNRKSTGLGLSFVKEVIELHQGIIKINSPVSQNRGTSVVVQL